MNDDIDLVNLYTLLKTHSVGNLVDAIEAKGIHGWDRFGRLKCFKVGTPAVVSG